MILCVVGPTAVGKTRLAESLSVKYDAIIINCDAMQVYKEMDIGTAKYTKEEDLGQEHFLFDIKSPNEDYTVYDYQKDLRRVLDEYKTRNIIVVGGTGLYLKAGLFDYEFGTRELQNYDEFTDEELYMILRMRGKSIGVHPNNRRRMISRLNSTGNNNRKDVLLYEDVIFIGLTTNREKLYSKIDKRVEEMMENGLLEEVKRLYKKYGLSKAMRTGIGYKEIVAYLKGLMTLDETVDLIKRKSRKYAKRQYTWFNHQMDIKWFETDYDDFSKTEKDVVLYIEKTLR